MLHVLAGIVLTLGVVVCFASVHQYDPRVRAQVVFFGLVLYTIGHGILWTDHLIRGEEGCEDSVVPDGDEED